MILSSFPTILLVYRANRMTREYFECYKTLSSTENRRSMNYTWLILSLYWLKIFEERHLIVIATLFRVQPMEETRKDNFNCTGPLQYQSQTSRKTCKLNEWLLMLMLLRSINFATIRISLLGEMIHRMLCLTSSTWALLGVKRWVGLTIDR